MNRIKKFKEYIKDRNHSDSADGNIISALMVLPLMFFLGLMAVDAYFFFSNNSQINDVVRDGAQNVSRVAGAGTHGRITRLEMQIFDYKTRAQLSEGPPAWNAVATGASANITPRNSHEYIIMDTLAQYGNLYRIEIIDVRCGVQNHFSGSAGYGIFVQSLSDRPWCTVEWRHRGLAFSPFGVFVNGTDNRSTTANVQAETILGPRTGVDNYTNYEEPRP